MKNDGLVHPSPVEEPGAGTRTSSLDWAAWLERRRAQFDVQHSFHRVCGLVTEAAGPGWSRVRMPLGPDVLNLRGAVHGGAISTLVDAAAGTAVAASTAPEERILGTVTLEVNFLRRASGGSLTAEGHVLRLGSAVAFVNVEVRDDDDSTVAVATSTLRLRLSREREWPTGQRSTP